MKKFLVTARFQWSEEMMQLIEEHRTVINKLIDEQVIEHYIVSMEVETAWITINANTKVIRSVCFSKAECKNKGLALIEKNIFRFPVKKILSVQLHGRQAIGLAVPNHDLVNADLPKFV